MRIDAAGLWLVYQGVMQCIAASQIVICTGQVAVNDLYSVLQGLEQSVHVIGGALQAGELDAQRAIEQGFRLGVSF